MGNTLSSLLHRFVFSKFQRYGSAVDDDLDDDLDDDEQEWGQVEYVPNGYSDDDLLTEDEDDGSSGMDSTPTTDSSDDEGMVTEGVGDKALQEAGPEADVVEEEGQLEDTNDNGGRDIPVREGGRCVVVERQQLHGLQEKFVGGKTLCVCGVMCASFKNHRRHVEYSSGKGKFLCAHCPKAFMYMGYLTQHQNQKHKNLRLNVLPHGDQDGKTFACRDCTLEFCSLSRLLVHRRTEHVNSRRFRNCEQSGDSDNSGDQPMQPDSTTGGQKRKLSAVKAAKVQGRRKRVKTTAGIHEEEQEPSSSNQSDPPRAAEPEDKRRCPICHKYLRRWNKDYMVKNWEKVEFCCHETVQAWMMKN